MEEKLLEKLHNMPIFRLSLGSKELFHSNFLEYLWDCDRGSFIQMIRNLYGRADILTANPEDYFLSREKENFDVCIYHTENKDENGTPIYDLILENKVKSIPYKEQLAEYVKKVAQRKQDAPAYLLLSLSKDFPDKGTNDVINVSVEIDDKKHNRTIPGPWKIINYSQLKGEIENQNKLIKQPYVDDYCRFIEALDELGEAVLNNIKNEYLFPEGAVYAYKKERLHDLYIKIRCSWFVARLKQELEGEKIPVKIVSKYEDRQPGYVSLNVAMNQGNGQIAAWICEEGNFNTKGKGKLIANTFEIVVQGNQYRHGINQMGYKPDEAKTKYRPDRLNELYTRLLPGSRSRQFLDFEGEFHQCFGEGTDVEPKVKKNFRYYGVPKAGPFDCYDDSHIYRYVSINKDNARYTTRELLETMREDIRRIFPNMPNLS